MLFGVPPGDAATLAGAVALCLVVSATGALAPALRVSPLSALRAD